MRPHLGPTPDQDQANGATPVSGTQLPAQLTNPDPKVSLNLTYQYPRCVPVTAHAVRNDPTSGRSARHRQSSRDRSSISYRRCERARQESRDHQAGSHRARNHSAKGRQSNHPARVTLRTTFVAKHDHIRPLWIEDRSRITHPPPTRPDWQHSNARTGHDPMAHRSPLLR
jgi:hypothetical protein